MIMLGNVSKKKKEVIATGALQFPMRISLKPRSHDTHKKCKTLTVSPVGICFLVISENISIMLEQQSELASEAHW